MKVIAALAIALAVLAWTAPAVQADSGNWTSVRILDCGARGTLTTMRNPAGFGTPFHDQDSERVLIPLRVVTNDVIVFEKRGIDNNALSDTTCEYLDPAGRHVVVTGLLTPASR
jgi:hypothetical protein